MTSGCSRRCARAGLMPHAVVWDDPDVDWTRFRLAVVRGIWDYFLKPAAFPAWLERVAPQVDLLNPPACCAGTATRPTCWSWPRGAFRVTPTVLVPAGARRPRCRRSRRARAGSRWW